MHLTQRINMNQLMHVCQPQLLQSHFGVVQAELQNDNLIFMPNGSSSTVSVSDFQSLAGLINRTRRKLNKYGASNQIAMASHLIAMAPNLNYVMTVCLFEASTPKGGKTVPFRLEPPKSLPFFASSQRQTCLT